MEKYGASGGWVQVRSRQSDDGDVQIEVQDRGPGIPPAQRDVQILALFHRHEGKVLDRNTIFNECWGMDYYPNSRTLDQHISQLRKKIEVDPKQPTLIQTVHGVGYRYDHQ